MDGPTPDELLADASEATGLDDFGDDWFMTPLRAWCDDLGQDNLTALGRRLFRNMAVRDLSRRLRVLDTLRRNPEIDDVEIPPIIHITGMERSGTTLLHNLLALTDGARSFLRWELMEPVPPPEAATAATDPRIEQVQASIEPLRGSLLERMHWVDADDPEECVWGFIDCGSFLGQAAASGMPAWREVLYSADLTPMFENYRRIIRLLTWKHPVPPGRPLVLKAPQIARRIDQFAEVFPEAQFVVPDRDPYRCMSSVAVMVRSIMDPLCVKNPIAGGAGHADGAPTWDVADMFERKLGAICDFDEAHPDRITHVPYPDLVREPVSVVAGIHDTLGREVDDDLPARIDAFLAEQRAGKRAAPPPRLDDLGFDQDAVRSTGAIARYVTMHDVAAERERITG